MLALLAMVLATPVAEASLYGHTLLLGDVAMKPENSGFAIGPGLGLGWQLGGGPVGVEAELAAGFGILPAFGELRPGIRWFTRTPWHSEPVLSLALNAGASVGGVPGKVSPVVRAEAALDMPLGGGPHKRLAFAVLAGEGSDGQYRTVGVRVGLGLAFGKGPELPPEPPPEPEGPLYYVPHPDCDCRPLESAVQRYEEQGYDTALLESAMVSTFVDGEPSGQAVGDGTGDGTGEGAAGSSTAGEVQGGLLVLAWPGDTVKVRGHEVEVGPDGVATVTVGQGLLEVEVMGGGRTDTRKVVVADGRGVWLRMKPPEIGRVPFDSNSSDLSDEALAYLEDFAKQAGDWRFELQGSYSPEGSTARNQELGRQRASVVRATLLELGLSEEQIIVVPPPLADPTLPPEVQRACDIVPLGIERETEEAQP